MGDITKTGVLCTRVITVFDTDGITPKTGLVNADFTTKDLTKDGAVDATAVTVTEINAGTRPGRYKVTWTPGSSGEYELRVAIPTYADRGFIFEFSVTTDGPLTLALIQASLDVPTANQNADALLDRAAAVDGKTPRQTLQILGAIAGKSSGDPAGPVTFKGLDGATSRIVATMDADGNRTAVSYP